MTGAVVGPAHRGGARSSVLLRDGASNSSSGGEVGLARGIAEA